MGGRERLILCVLHVSLSIFLVVSLGFFSESAFHFEKQRDRQTDRQEHLIMPWLILKSYQVAGCNELNGGCSRFGLVVETLERLNFDSLWFALIRFDSLWLRADNSGDGWWRSCRAVDNICRSESRSGGNRVELIHTTDSFAGQGPRL